MAENDLIFEELSRFQFINHNPSSEPQQITESKQLSMVVIRDCRRQNEMSVFPPVNHENLHIPTKQYQKQQHPLPISRALSPSEVTEAVPASSDPGYADWFEFAIGVLRAKMTRFASCLGFRNDSVRGAVWSIWGVLGVAAVVVSWWLCRRAGRRRRMRERMDQLQSIIEEKDKKIVRLLHQIAQMNEVLVRRCKELAS